MERLHLRHDVAEAHRLEEVPELRANERITARGELMLVERRPIPQRLGAVRIDEERRVQDLVADNGASRHEDAPHFREHARRIRDMLEDPAEERGIEGLWTELERRGVALHDGPAILRPGNGIEEAASLF